MGNASVGGDYEFSPIPQGGWRLVTDGVMGGVSRGDMAYLTVHGESCIGLRGTVSTDNNGGFVQIVRELDEADPSAEGFSGITLEVVGNGERYNLHLRTSDLWLPWQSYRAAFATSSAWTRVYLPFSEFEPYRTGVPLHLGKLRRIAVVAIGRDFDADVCVKGLALYRSRD
jgi:hypothetical protein